MWPLSIHGRDLLVYLIVESWIYVGLHLPFCVLSLGPFSIRAATLMYPYVYFPLDPIVERGLLT